MPENRKRFRNPVARSPLLRKSGPHQRSRSGERQGLQNALDAELDDWLEEREEQGRQVGEPVSKGTGSSFCAGHEFLRFAGYLFRNGDHPPPQ
jgi:hypothetical protein